eukprot:c2551_g1_i1.p1 GENE.c2551_g1_i1~~c2551_g1_i1.p1  ORF type:complete len:388 (-),score=55.75 c2551_g1_i1:187-1350(-)
MLLVLGVLVLMLNYATAMRLVRHVKGDDFVFVEKFCFNDDGPGHIQGSGLTYSDRPVKFALFTDEKGGWNDITTRTTCEDKLNRAKTVVDIDHGVLFKMDVKVIDTDGPHFWYLAIVNCHSTVDIELDLEFINSGSGCFKQFSNDEKGLMFVYFIMFAGSGVLFYFQLKSVQDMMERKSLHPIVQIVALGVSMLLFSLLLHSTHYLVFAIDGRGLNLMESLAEFVYVLFQVVFITTIIMLAKGWTISSIELTERRNMAIALGVYTLMHIFLFVWTSHQQHKASTVYKYGTGPGVGIVLMRTCIWLWFLLCLRDTVTQVMFCTASWTKAHVVRILLRNTIPSNANCILLWVDFSRFGFCLSLSLFSLLVLSLHVRGKLSSLPCFWLLT